LSYIADMPILIATSIIDCIGYLQRKLAHELEFCSL